MKKLITTTIILAAAIIAYIVISTEHSERRNPADSTKPTIKIGATLPLTGDMGWAGVPVKKAIELSLRDIKSKNDLKYNYELIFEDDRMEPKNTALNYERMVSINDIKAILSMWVSSNIVSQRTEKNKVIHMGCAWGNGPATGQYNFNHTTLPKEQVQAMVEEFNRRGIKKIGYIHNPNKAGEEIGEELTKVLKENNIELVFESIFDSNHKDFRTDIAKMKNQDIDILIVLLLSPGMEVFIKQSNELDYKPQITSFDYLSYNPELFEGFWYVRDPIGSPEFLTYFQKELNETPISCIANLYDGLDIIIKGFERTSAQEGEIPNADDVVETILNMKDLGNSVGEVYIDKEGNIHAQPNLEIIQNRQSIPL